MDDRSDLMAEIENWNSVSVKLLEMIETAETQDIVALGKTPLMGVAIAGLIENYYTAVETLLYRISQRFGNSLEPARWHSELLRRMTLDVPDTRPAVLSNDAASKLDELMRFRHFKRYYFQLEWDWDRLDHMVSTIRVLQPTLVREFQAFREFVESLGRIADE